MRRILALGTMLLMVAVLAAGCGPKKHIAQGPSYYGPIAAPQPVVLFVPPDHPVTTLPGSGPDATGAVFLAGALGTGTSWTGWWVSATYGTLLTQPGTAAGTQGAFSQPFTTTSKAVTWFVPGRNAPLVQTSAPELDAEVAWWWLNQPFLPTKADYGKYLGHLQQDMTSNAITQMEKMPPSMGTAQLIGAWTAPSQPNTLYLEWNAFNRGPQGLGENRHLWTAVTNAYGKSGWKVSRIEIAEPAIPGVPMQGIPTVKGYTQGADWYSTFFGQQPLG